MFVEKKDILEREEQRMNGKVTPGDIMQLGLHVPVVNACLQLWQDGHFTWEEALQLAVSELCSCLSHTQEMLLEAENTRKIIVIADDIQTQPPICVH